jgi:acylphosphatase
MDERHTEQKVCYRCVVGGRVQGVFFRAATREQAMRLGLTGYARNLANGRVEVLACGDAAAVAQLRDWLRNGPTQASVTGVACEPLDYVPHTGFAIDQ